MRSVLITGSSGFIGRHLKEALLKDGVKVIEFSLENNQRVNNLEDFSKLPQVDVVFHLAAVSGYKDSNTHTTQAYEINVVGTVNVLEYCRRVGAKMLFPSTYVYDKPYEEYKVETDKTSPTTHYAFTKLLGERLCRFYSRVFKVNTSIMRMSNVYGGGQNDKYIVPMIANGLKKGTKIPLTKPDIERCYIHVHDLVEAFIKLARAETKPGEVFNLAYPEPTTLKDLVEMMEKVTGSKGKIKYSGKSRPNDIEKNRYSIKKIKDKIKWQPKIDLEKGLKMYFGKD